MTNLSVITIGLSEYSVEAWRINEAEDSRRAIEDALRARGATVRQWTPQANAAQIRQQWVEWCAETDSSCVVYWIGHGEYTSGNYWLALADSEEPLWVGKGLPGRDIAQYLQAQQMYRAENDCWTLIVLDTCGSGAGAWEIWSSFAPPDLPDNLGVIGTTDDGAGFAGVFSAIFDQVLDEFNGNDTDGVPLRELARRLEDRLGPNKVHHAFRVSAKLPRRAGEMPAVLAPADIHAELRAFLVGTGDKFNHFYAKAQGAEIGELAWYFTGRERERRDVARWLETADHGMSVITGAPGSGKSALLGMILAGTDKRLIEALDAAGYHVGSSDLCPAGVEFDAVLHLGSRTFNDSANALAAALDLAAGDDPDLIFSQLAKRSRKAERITILVDALDESRDPYAIASGLLRRIGRIRGVRLVVGTRRSVHEDPDVHEDSDALAAPDNGLLTALVSGTDQVIRLESEPGAVRAYVTRRIAGRLPDLGPAAIGVIAEEIAGRDQPFLFARLAVHEILASASLVADAGAREDLLDHGHRGIFASAVRRFRRETPESEALLHSLAYVQGNGFSRTNGVWAMAASALHDAPISDPAIPHALILAAPYIMRDTENGQEVYRLAHRTFTEFYRSEDSSSGPERLILDAFMARAIADPASIGPYLQNHLSGHVSAVGAWQALAEHPRVLDQLDPDAVASEAARSAFGRTDLPVSILATLMARSALVGTSPGARSLVRELAAYSLGLSGQSADSSSGPYQVQWAALRAASAHIALAGHSGPVPVVAFGVLSTDRTLLASGSADQTVRLWDPETGRPLGDPLTGHTNVVSAVAFGRRPDGRLVLASGSFDKTVRLWDPETGRPLGDPLTGHTGGVSGVAFGRLPDGQLVLASSSVDETVRLWDPETGRPLGDPLPSISGAVLGVAFGELQDGQVVLACCMGYGVVRLWDPRTGRHVGDPIFCQTEGKRVNTVALDRLPNQRALLATGARTGAVELFDPDTARSVAAPLLGGGYGEVYQVAFGHLPDGRVLLASGSASSAVRLWSPEISQPVADSFPHEVVGVFDVALAATRDGQVLLATSSYDDRVRLWNPETGEEAAGPLFRAPVGMDEVVAAGVSGVAIGQLPDGRVILALGSSDETVHLWDLETGSPVGKPLAGHTERVCGVAFGQLPDGQLMVASASADRTVRLWTPLRADPGPQRRRSLRRRSGSMRLKGHTGPVSAVAFGRLADGREILASAGDDGKVCLWDPIAAERLGGPLTGHAGWVSAVAFGRLADGRVILASAGQDGTIRLWDPVTRQPLGSPLTGHTQDVRTVAFSQLADGRMLLASGGADRTVRLWDPVTRKPIGDPAVVAPILPESIAMQGCRLFVGSSLGLIRLDVTDVIDRFFPAASS